MPQEHSDKSRFQSRYGGGWVTFQQWLAETMVTRQAKKDGKELPERFWQLTTYKRQFLLQVRYANGLLGTFSEQAITNGLKTKEGQRAFSLAAPFLNDLFKIEQERLDRQARLTPPTPKPVEQPKPDLPNNRPSLPNKKKSILNKLKDIDNGAEKE